MGRIARLKVSAGGLTVAVEAPEKILAPSRRRYAPFASNKKAAARLKLRAAPARGGVWEPRIRKTGGGFECRGSQFAWEIKKNGIGNGTLRPTEQNLDSLLRTAYCALLPERGGALMHAASAVRNGTAHLFVGPSGAGKTTISRRLAQAPGVKILSDELPILLGGRSGFTVHSTPFWGEFRPPENNGSGRLGGIFFLAGGSRDSIELKDLTATEAQKRLLRCLVSFERSVETVSLGWDLLIRALQGRPLLELRWRLDTPAADLARRLW